MEMGRQEAVAEVPLPGSDLPHRDGSGRLKNSQIPVG